MSGLLLELRAGSSKTAKAMMGEAKSYENLQKKQTVRVFMDW